MKRSSLLKSLLAASVLFSAGDVVLQAQDKATWSKGSGTWSELVWATTDAAGNPTGTDVAYSNLTTTHAIFDGAGGTVDLAGQTYKARVLIFNADYTITNGTFTRTL